MHDEYANECFKLYLLHLGRYCGMENRGSLPQARSALREHWANNMDFFRSSNVEKQVRYVKKQLIKARNRIAKEASAKWAPTKWSSEDLAKYALTLHKVNTFGVKGDSHANWVVRRKVELLEQVAILEVCGELGIDLFDDSHEGREWIRYRSAEHNFIVDLPDTPQVCAESGHATVITEYVCDNDEAIVRVGVTEHRRGFIDAVGAPALLEQYRVVLSDVWQGYTINFDDGGEFLGYPAVRTTMLSDDGTAAVYCLVVITDRYEYELVAESFDELDGDGTGQERFHRLFESFQFVEGP